MSDEILDFISELKSGKIYNKYPIVWFKYGHVIECISKKVSSGNLKGSLDIYMVPHYVSHCEHSFKKLKEERANQVYKGRDCEEELDCLEKNFEILINILKDMLEGKKYDLVEEIESLYKVLEKRIKGTSTEVKSLKETSNELELNNNKNDV